MLKFTSRTIANRKALEKELKKILAAGYSVSISERVEDTFAVAAPIRDSSCEVVAALGISGPSSRLNEGSLDILIDCVRKGAARFSRELGYNEQ
jgi:DNA-binding IclR family transcriptional regulator